MSENETIFIGGGGVDYADPQELLLKFGNRHGMIAGATGTGKTVTLQILAESFSNAGVPVFLSDVKGDLSGLAVAGSPAHKLHDKLISRAEKIGFGDYDYSDFPVTFWDLFGEKGHPIRTTITEMGPLLLSRLMELTEAQEGTLNIAFRIADEQGLLLIDIKDLRALLTWMGEHTKELTLEYGSVATKSIGAILRNLLVLENQGGEKFFGEPALELSDLMRTTPGGKGRINILASDKLMQSPTLYATFLMWLLSELFENLPEVGDPDKPKFVFFFDEAHLLFEDAPKSLIKKVEQVARLIRSKGVGVYFISQNPDDVPEDILGQLGNRFQHALRAFTPRDHKALRLASETFRPNPRFETMDAIRDCGVGEALVSTLEGKGAPSVVERTLIRPPSSRLGPIDMDERKAVIAGSPIAGVYEAAKDRESAFEVLRARAEAAAKEAEEAEKREADGELKLKEFNAGRRYSADEPKTTRKKSTRSSRSDSVGEVFAKSLARQLGGSAGRKLVRGVLGSLFKGR
jgi:DNA helicase HerA-like ATPase